MQQLFNKKEPTMNASLDSLNAQFGIPDALTIATGQGGLPCVEIATAACRGRVYFHGAHVTHWQPAGHEPALFVSERSSFEADKPIRGGVPLCFPWFGPHPGDPNLPPHGFVRTLPWELQATRLGDAGKVALVMVLKSNDQTRRLWPFDFEIRHRITMGDQLILKLETHNTSKTPIRFEEALHTYLAVGDARHIEIAGCESIDYLDKTANFQRQTQAGPVRITSETDRIYVDTKRGNVVHDPVLKRQIVVQKTDSNDTVVWNPWSEKAKAIPDLGDDEWPRFVCVETCNVKASAVELAPGAIHQIRAIVSLK